MSSINDLEIKNGKLMANTSRVDRFNIVINVDDSFFVKIISFFKELFGINMVNNVGEFRVDY